MRTSRFQKGEAGELGDDEEEEEEGASVLAVSMGQGPLSLEQYSRRSEHTARGRRDQNEGTVQHCPSESGNSRIDRMATVG